MFYRKSLNKGRLYPSFLSDRRINYCFVAKIMTRVMDRMFRPQVSLNLKIKYQTDISALTKKIIFKWFIVYLQSLFCNPNSNTFEYCYSYQKSMLVKVETIVKKICFELGPMLPWKPVYTYIFNNFARPYDILKTVIRTQTSILLTSSGRFSIKLHANEQFKYLIFKTFLTQNPNSFPT